MSIQVLIIGLGQFGMSLARTLSEKGTEVIAVQGARCCNLCNRCKRTVYTYNSNFKTDGM